MAGIRERRGEGLDRFGKGLFVCLEGGGWGCGVGIGFCWWIWDFV